MKKTIVFLAFILFSSIGISQRYYPNTLFVSFQPGDLGLGVRYDRQHGKWSYYGSASYGRYHGVHGDWFVKDHIRLGAGASVIVYHDRRYSNFLTGGLSLHHYGNLINRWDPNITMPVNESTNYIFWPVSFEAGFGIIMGRFAFCARLDVVKFEMALDFGLKF
jgi:hypothetical protein